MLISDIGEPRADCENLRTVLDRTRRHAMLKTVTFTLMHFCIAFSVTYALTGSIAVSGLLAAVEPLCNSVGFYFHEKIWQRFERRDRRNQPIPAHAWLHHQA